MQAAGKTPRSSYRITNLRAIDGFIQIEPGRCRRAGLEYSVIRGSSISRDSICTVKGRVFRFARGGAQLFPKDTPSVS